MQLFALNENSDPIFANAAIRGKDYTCLECQGAVRVRGGMHRQNHFYHLQLTASCRQNGKGMEHIQLQCHLHALLPECTLEQRFPTIQRIADVVWWPEKIIFEIQCSPITADEVRARNQDYATLGFRVVWLLHDKRFNARRLSAAEEFLTPHPHYYTNINKQGSGIIYDQFDHTHKALRRFKSQAFPVDLATPVRSISLAQIPLPHRLQKRITHAGLFFAGDLHEQLHNSDLFAQAIPKRPKLHLLNILTRPYRVLFNYLLEKASN